MSLSGNVASLATRLATEFNDIRAEITSALAGKVNTSLLGADNGVAELDSNGWLDPDQFGASPWRIQRYASATGTIAAPNETDVLKEIVATGNVTIPVPSSWWEREVIRFEVYASGGARTATFAAGYGISTGVTRGAYSIPSGQSLFAAAEYSFQQSKWILTAATISAA